jgi:hypothetical protein
MMVIISKIKFLIRSWPYRAKRLGLHLAYPFLAHTKHTNPIKPLGFRGWFVNAFCYVMDVIALPEVLEILSIAFLWRIRPLDADEILKCQVVFGDSIDYSAVTIDRGARVGMRYADAYVTFNTINYRHELPDYIFIHEMVHIWQYQQFGSMYIPHALHAQANGGYDYGGPYALFQGMKINKKLIDFNMEQQAEIIEDFYKILMESDIDDDSDTLKLYDFYRHRLISDSWVKKIH